MSSAACLPLVQLLEAALCLALQQKELDASAEVQKGGVLTPASGALAARPATYQAVMARHVAFVFLHRVRRKLASYCWRTLQGWACCWWSACAMLARLSRFWRLVPARLDLVGRLMSVVRG